MGKNWLLMVIKELTCLSDGLLHFLAKCSVPGDLTRASRVLPSVPLFYRPGGIRDTNITPAGRKREAAESADYWRSLSAICALWLACESIEVPA